MTVLCLFSILFFSVYCAHCVLPSFPTRRSSDLVSADGQEKAVAKIQAPGFFGEMGLMTGEPRTATVVISPISPKNPDRKSTRLNSSHTVISYAVFCLKKKKKRQYQ